MMLAKDTASDETIKKGSNIYLVTDRLPSCIGNVHTSSDRLKTQSSLDCRKMAGSGDMVYGYDLAGVDRLGSDCLSRDCDMNGVTCPCSDVTSGHVTDDVIAGKWIQSRCGLKDTTQDNKSGLRYSQRYESPNAKDIQTTDLVRCDSASSRDVYCGHVTRKMTSSCQRTTPMSNSCQALLTLSLSSLILFIERTLRISTGFSGQKGWVRISPYVIMLSVICLTNASPVVKRQVEEESTNFIDPTNYLMKFGFLPQALLETEALRTADELEDGIRSFQRFANLKETGVFDDETKEKMRQPRCGMPDIMETSEHARRHHHGDRTRPKRYVLGPSKWDKNALTFRILNYTPDLSQRQVQDAIRRAFFEWSQVTYLTFHEVYYGEADMFIKFARYYHTDGYPFDGPGMILAHAFFPGDDKGGDVHFDEDETWTAYSYEGTNLFSVAAHEIGHALGLAHSDTLGALMYPWYQGYMPNFQLHHDDINAIQYLYGRKEPSFPDGPSYTVRPEDPSNPPVTPGRPVTTTPWQRPTRPPPTSPAPTTRRTPHIPDDPNSKPDPCTMSVDAIGNIRSEIMVFKGNWFWRIDDNGVMPNYPVELNRLWFGLPEGFASIDAVYERPGDGKIVFFKGDRYYVFSANELDNEYRPNGRPITELGLPADVRRVDAAFVWGYNTKTYLVTGDMYWRYNEDLGHMDYDYPRDMTMWQGVRLPVDAAFRDLHGVTHFVKGTRHWEFNDRRMQVRHGHRHLGVDFLNCNLNTTQTPSFGGSKDEFPDLADSCPPAQHSISLLFLVFSFLYWNSFSCLVL